MRDSSQPHRWNVESSLRSWKICELRTPLSSPRLVRRNGRTIFNGESPPFVSPISDCNRGYLKINYNLPKIRYTSSHDATWKVSGRLFWSRPSPMEGGIVEGADPVGLTLGAAAFSLSAHKNERLDSYWKVTSCSRAISGNRKLRNKIVRIIGVH